MPWCSLSATPHIVSFVIVVVFFEKVCVCERERETSIGLLHTGCRHKQGVLEFCHLQEIFRVSEHSIQKHLAELKMEGIPVPTDGSERSVHV